MKKIPFFPFFSFSSTPPWSISGNSPPICRGSSTCSVSTAAFLGFHWLVLCLECFPQVDPSILSWAGLEVQGQQINCFFRFAWERERKNIIMGSFISEWFSLWGFYIFGLHVDIPGLAGLWEKLLWKMFFFSQKGFPLLRLGFLHGLKKSKPSGIDWVKKEKIVYKTKTLEADEFSSDLIFLYLSFHSYSAEIWKLFSGVILLNNFIF